MHENTPADRRKDNRAQVLLRVEYHQPDDLLSDYLTNLAEGGLFVHTQVPFEVGQSLAFSLSFPGILEPIALVGVVRWQRLPDPEHAERPTGVGVEFVFESEAQRSRVRALVAEMRAAANAPIVTAQPLRVLLVEDNEFVHDLFRHAVGSFEREAGVTGRIEIISATDGSQALARLHDGPIDLAIVDHFLPSLLGSDLVAQMRAQPRFAQTPILVVSVGGAGVRQAALAAGADLYIDKPVLLKQLLSTMRLLLSKRKLIAELLETAW